MGRRKQTNGQREAETCGPPLPWMRWIAAQCCNLGRSARSRRGSILHTELGLTPAHPTPLVVPPYASYLTQKNQSQCLNFLKNQLRKPVILLKALLPDRQQCLRMWVLSQVFHRRLEASNPSRGEGR